MTEPPMPIEDLELLRQLANKLSGRGVSMMKLYMYQVRSLLDEVMALRLKVAELQSQQAQDTKKE